MALEPEYCLVIFSAIGSCNRRSKATVKRTTKKRAAWFASYVGHFTTHVQTCLTTNRVSVRSCVNTDFWLDTITRKSRHTRDLRQLLQNKFDKSQWDVQHVQILLQKQIELAWTILYFLQQLCFLATTWFFARQVWSVGGKMGNITMYLVFICSNVTLQNRLVFLVSRFTIPWAKDDRNWSSHGKSNVIQDNSLLQSTPTPVLRTVFVLQGGSAKFSFLNWKISCPVGSLHAFRTNSIFMEN